DPRGEEAGLMAEKTPEPPRDALYTAKLSDPRERAAQPRGKARGRAVTRAEPTSDVTRFRGFAIAAVAGGAVAFAAALLTGAAGAGGNGTLARPHANAKVPCTACHTATPATTSGDDGNAAIVPSSACAGCHGPHPSQRRGHAAALAKGAMTCS